MIQQISFLDGSYTGVKREVNKERIPRDKILCQNGIIGYMTSFAAGDGLDVIDYDGKVYAGTRSEGICQYPV